MKLNFRRSFSFILASKLKVLKARLKVWNKEVFGNVVVQKDLILNQAGFLDSKEREATLF